MNEYSVSARRGWTENGWEGTTGLPTFTIVAWSQAEAESKARAVVGPDLVPGSLCVVDLGVLPVKEF